MQVRAVTGADGHLDEGEHLVRRQARLVVADDEAGIGIVLRRVSQQKDLDLSGRVDLGVGASGPALLRDRGSIVSRNPSPAGQ